MTTLDITSRDAKESLDTLRKGDKIPAVLYGPLAGVAVTIVVDAQGICRDARIAVGAVNPAPLLIRQASEWLVGRQYSPELAERVAHAAIQTGKPLTTSASTPVYRREMIRVFTRRGLEEAWGLPRPDRGARRSEPPSAD